LGIVGSQDRLCAGWVLAGLRRKLACGQGEIEKKRLFWVDKTYRSKHKIRKAL
jgi:hypothetical protein